MRRTVFTIPLCRVFVCLFLVIGAADATLQPDKTGDNGDAGVSTPSAIAAQTDIPGPVGSGEFGKVVVVLPNGNFVVTDPLYDDGLNIDVGAVHLYNGTTLSLISTLKGSTANDILQGGPPPVISVLTNGNFVVNSFVWDGPGAVDAGAVTFCSETTGCSGAISNANSLVGTTTDDRVGSTGVTTLSNGNYVVGSHGWDNGINFNAGAATFCNGTSGCAGSITGSNSLVGGRATDTVSGNGIIALTNNNYVVKSSQWTGFPATAVGAATFCNGTTGCTGLVSPANSLVGSIAFPGRQVGLIVTALTNGNYVVRSPFWDTGPPTGIGAATFCNGTTGCTGEVSSANSLIGSSQGDTIGIDVNNVGGTALPNGNYLINSQNWDNPSPARLNVGAVTFCNGTTGCIGTVSASNSLIGSTASDVVGSGSVIGLPNGNYVLGTTTWDNGALNNAGAVTFCSGTTGCTGEINASNSLLGSAAGGIGNRLAALTNGNYVIGSPSWGDGVVQRGAATYCSGTTGCTGTSISGTISLIGVQSNDQVGRKIVALSNGNYVVNNSQWRNGAIFNAGAATFCNGTTGCTGLVSPANSLVGSTVSDSVGESSNFDGIIALPNGNYIVNSKLWNNTAPATADVGAITFCNGTTGCVGMVVSSSNSLIGSTANDQIGNDQSGIPVPRVFSNSRYVVQSPFWDNGAIPNAGAVTLGNGNTGTVGTISSANSVLGTVTNGISPFPGFAYDPPRNCLYVGRAASNIVSVLCLGRTPFDFDGDGRADISVFRPSNAVWYLDRSTEGSYSITWGLSTDKIVPADYDRDGKTDIAIFRDGDWWWINSSNGTVSVVHWGTAGDIPVPADYTGDGRAELAIFRDGVWWTLDTTNFQHTVSPFGLPGDIPVAADYDGDGRADIAIFRDGAWWILQTTNGLSIPQLGLPGDDPIQAAFLP